MHACRGIWRPDSLPSDAPVRQEFFEAFGDVSLKTLGLQLSEDTVSKVNGRIARSFNDAVSDLARSIRRLGYELDERLESRNTLSEEPSPLPGHEAAVPLTDED